MVLGLLGEEGAKDVEVRPVFAQQDAKQLHFFGRPHLRLLLGLDGLAAGDRLGLAASLVRLDLGLLLNGEGDTVNSMESMMVLIVCLGLCSGVMHHSLMSCWLSMRLIK